VTAPIFPLKAEGEGPNELAWGKNIVDAAKEVGVKFFIWRCTHKVGHANLKLTQPQLCT
jgi:hypothetical protein